VTASSVAHLPAPLSSADNSLAVAVDRARQFADAAQAENTRRAYRSGWRSFTAYCMTHGLSPLPATPQTVVLYATHLAQYAKLGTIRQRLAAIANMHEQSGLQPPVAHKMVRRVIQGIARTNGSAQTKKSAITLDLLRAMLLEIRGDDVKAKRDRAILLLGFAAALRRSELAALSVEDIQFERRGLRIVIRRSKTDQEAEGVEIAVPIVKNPTLCAVRAVRAWLDASGITAGRLFRSFTLARTMQDHPIDGRDVANLVKSLSARARLEGDFSGHSLRAGFVTSAAEKQVPLDSIARTTRHKSLTVLTGYIRRAQAFDGVALTSIIA
jgi:integrase